jgi:polysaccharide biosynthesis protein PslH
MRILFVVPYVPNLIRVRPYNLIRGLTAAGHELTVLTLWSDRAERADAAALRAHCQDVVALPISLWQSLRNCLLALPAGVPLQSAYCWQPALARRLTALAGARNNGKPAFDVVHVEHLRGARYGLHCRQLFAGIPIIWDSVDCISHLFRQAAVHSQSRLGRWLARLELRSTERHEAWLAAQFERVLVTAATDKSALEQLLPGPGRRPAPANVKVLPNGVDLDYFYPGETAARATATLVISGKMSYHANVTMTLYFLEVIMPLIWAQRSDVRLDIVGKDPPRAIRTAGAHANVRVTGAVADIRPYLQQATIAVAPLPYGAGIQNKVLEAMACATPVVATPQAVSALAAVPGQDVLVAQQPEATAEALLSLLAAPEMGRQIGQNGRCYVERRHQWANIIRQLEETYLETIAAARR